MQYFDAKSCSHAGKAILQYVLNCPVVNDRAAAEQIYEYFQISNLTKIGMAIQVFRAAKTDDEFVQALSVTRQLLDLTKKEGKEAAQP